MKRLLLALFIGFLALSTQVSADGVYTRSKVGNTSGTGGGGSGITGSGTAGQVSYWNGNTTQTGDPSMTYSSGLLEVRGTVSATTLMGNGPWAGIGQANLGVQDQSGRLSFTRGSNGNQQAATLGFADASASQIFRFDNNLGGGIWQYYINNIGRFYMSNIRSNFSTPVFIGDFSATPSADLHVSGSIIVTRIPTNNGTGPVCTTSATGVFSYSTTGCTTSSRIFKEHVQTLGNGLQLINALTPVIYDYKPEFQSMYGSQQQIGLIAEDVDPVLPMVVGHFSASGLPGVEDGTPYANVDYSRLTAPLIGAVKELSAKVVALEQRVQQLENK